MKRNDFINRLFNNGDGLTLDQIARIEAVEFAEKSDGMMEDLKDYENPEETCRDLVRDFIINQLSDCADLLELRDKLREYQIDPTDMQVYHLFYAVCGKD